MLGPGVANLDITPLLATGIDTSADFGFQGDFSSLAVVADLARWIPARPAPHVPGSASRVLWKEGDRKAALESIKGISSQIGMAPVGNPPADFAKAIAEESGRWAKLPPLALSAATQERLRQVMPGTQSHLDIEIPADKGQRLIDADDGLQARVAPKDQG